MRDLTERVLEYRPSIVVITADSDPLRWQYAPAWQRLTSLLHTGAGRPLDIHVETTGAVRPSNTIALTAAHFHITVPTPDARLNHKAMSAFARLETATVNVTCRTEGEVRAATALAEDHHLTPGRLWVSVHPDAEHPDAVTAAALTCGANVSPSGGGR